MKVTFVFTMLLVFLGAMMTSAENCKCPDDYTPVCGKTGTTYGNLCYLRCDGGVFAYDGECRHK